MREMLEALCALAFIALLVAVPLGWREWRDWREARELVVRADVQYAVNRRLGGESFVSVRVRPGAPWRPGRVELSAPSGWEWLIDRVWMPALERVPPDYELVVKPGSRLARVHAAHGGEWKPAT